MGREDKDNCQSSEDELQSKQSKGLERYSVWEATLRDPVVPALGRIPGFGQHGSVCSCLKADVDASYKVCVSACMCTHSDLLILHQDRYGRATGCL